MEMNSQPHAPAVLLPGKNPRVDWIGEWVVAELIELESRWPQSRSGLFGEDRNFSPLSGYEYWVIQPVA